MAQLSNNQRYLFWLGGVAAIMALAMAALLVYQNSQRQAIQESISQRADSPAGLTFHLEREFLRFSQVLDHFVSTPSEADRDELTLRYDIFQSRLSLLRENPSTTGLVNQPEYMAVIPKLNAMVQDADRIFNQKVLDPVALKALLRSMNALHSDVLTLTTAAIKSEARQFNGQAERMLDQSELITWLMAGQTALLLASAIALTLRQFRQDAEKKAADALNEALRQERRKADAANEAKSQFLANMSHELRTPFNGILGMLKLLQSTGLNANQLDYVYKTERVAGSLLALVNDILDFSKVEAGKLAIDVHAFQMEGLLRDVSMVLSANVGSKAIEVVYDIDSRIAEVVEGDSTRIRQVLLNLGSNAIKFTEKGQVIVRLEREPLQEGSRRHAVRFSVIDTGIGIAPDKQKLIFSGFSQAEASTTRRFGGTGLGLAISKRLVELMGGQLELESELGAGSNFSFVLELPIPEDVPHELRAELPGTNAPLHVLIVDDNPISRGVLQRITQAWNWPTLVAESGEEALQIIQSRQAQAQPPFEVMLVDWYMPGMDGWALVKAVREMELPPGYPSPNVVMITGHAREELMLRTQQEQSMLDGFLIKPITAAMLREAACKTSDSTARLRQLPRPGTQVRHLVGLKILVVEDNSLNQQVAEELLTMEGAQVSIAGNGQLALDAVQAASPPFDVVLMDLQMPVMDGYAAHRYIRDVLKMTELPVIAMTANAMASDREACLREGMNDHVGKPFDLQNLVTVICRVTGHSETSPVASFPTMLGEVAEAAVAMAPSPQGQVGLPTPNDNNGGMVDVATALGRMAGMQSLYVRAAKEFADTLTQTLSDYRVDIDNGHWAEARSRMHTLKGVAGTIGIAELSTAAKYAEIQCANPADLSAINAHLDKLQQIAVRSIQAVHQVIAELSHPVAPSALPRVQAAPLVMASASAKEAIVALRDLCAADDLAALEKLAEIRPQLQEFPADAVSRLESALQSLDLADAAQVCAELIG